MPLVPTGGDGVPSHFSKEEKMNNDKPKEPAPEEVTNADRDEHFHEPHTMVHIPPQQPAPKSGEGPKSPPHHEPEEDNKSKSKK